MYKQTVAAIPAIRELDSATLPQYFVLIFQLDKQLIKSSFSEDKTKLSQEQDRAKGVNAIKHYKGYD